MGGAAGVEAGVEVTVGGVGGGGLDGGKMRLNE